MSGWFKVPFDRVSVAVAQDLLCVYAGTAMAFELVEATLSQVTETSVEILPIAIKRLGVAGQLAGSGGSTVIPTPLYSDQAAAVVTAHANDTTMATASVIAMVHADAFSELNGYSQRFDPPIVAKPGEAISFVLEAAPASARTTSAVLLIRECF